MKEISKQDIETLLRLQEAEIQIVKLESLLALDEEKEAEILARQETFEKGLAEQKERIQTNVASCQEIEEEIRVIDQRIAKSNETLRMVRSNKEYQALLREVEDNRRRKDGIETSLLEQMDEKERLATIIEETENEFFQLQTQIKAEREGIRAQHDQNQSLLEKYKSEQKKIGEELEPSLMNLFKRISKMNRGFVVAKVQEAVCMGCFMNVPPQLYIEVQRGKNLIFCPQCSRILYYETGIQEV